MMGGFSNGIPTHPGSTPVEIGRVDSGRIVAIAVLPDGRIVTGSAPGLSDCDYGQLLVWDPDRPGTLPIELDRIDGTWISAVAVLPDGRIVTATGNVAGDEGRLAIWDLTHPNANPVELSRHLRGWLTAISVLTGGRIVTSSYGPSGDGGRLLVWDADSGCTNPLELGRGIDGPLSTVKVLPDGQIAIVADGQLEIWDLPALEMTHRMVCGAEALAVASGDGQRTDLVIVHPVRPGNVGLVCSSTSRERQGI